MTTAARVRELLSAHLEPPTSDDEPFKLQSFDLIVLVEALEDAFGVRVKAADVVPENFGTVARIVGYLERSQAR